MNFFRTLIGIASIAIASAAAADAAYPDKPIRIIMPFAPGGGGDLVLRSLSDKLGQRLGQAVVIDNKPGASGFIGAQMVAKAPPDGYTLLMGFDGSLVTATQLIKPPFDPMADFTPVTKLADAPLVLVAHSSVKENDIPGLIAYSKTLPGGLSYGSAGRGTTHHMVGELLALKTGMHLTHVAYKGGGQAVSDAAAGQVPLLVTVIPTAAGFIKEGRLKAIAVTSRERSPSLPNVPTMAEQGVRDFNVMSWYGIFAPARTPAPIVDRLQKEFAAVLADPEVKAIYLRAGFEPVGNKPAEFDRQYRADYKRWAEVVKEANIPAE
mgnify:CR=1 FL=1